MSETIEDIVREMREANFQPPWYQEQINSYTDRIEAAHKRECGNAAKMREALLAVKELDFYKEEDCYDFDRIIGDALSAPLRNCDVGTVEEQSSRYNKFCFANRTYERGCGGCPLAKDPYCEFAWAQMPYEEGGKNGNK